MTMSKTPLSATGHLEINFRQRLARPDVERKLHFRGFNIEYTRVTSAIEYDYSSVGARHFLALHDLVLDDGELSVESLPKVSSGDLRDTMTYVPAGKRVSGWSRTTGRQNSFTVLHFDPALLSDETERLLGSEETRPLIYFGDPALLGTMKKLESVIADGLDHSSVYVETLALLATLELGRLQMGNLQGETGTGKLSASQQKLLRDYIEDHLSHDISLDDLSQLVQLSRFHLARLFKSTLGLPPHQFVTLRRLELAKRLLRDTYLGIGEIADMCGFSSPGPFIKAFRQHVGVTPSVYRRQ